MELIKISQVIQQKIELLQQGRKELEKRAQAKAEAVSAYEKALAKTILMIKNSEEEIIWCGEKIQNPPVTIMEKIAKGMVWEQKLATDLAESQYRNAVIGMSALESELNACQSILRYMEEV